MKTNNLSLITKATVIIAFAMLIVFSPSIPLINYIEWHDSQRVVQLTLLGLLLVDAIVSGLNKQHMLHIPMSIRIGFFAVLALSVGSTLLSIEPRFATIEVTVFVALCYLSLFVSRLYGVYKDNFIKYLSYALWASIGLYMASFYTGYLTAILLKKPLIWPDPFYGFSNIRLFQQYQLWSLGLICIPLLAFNLKGNVRLMLYAGLGIWWVLLFYAASRGVTLGWLLALATTAIVYKKLAWPFVRIQIIAGLTGLVTYQLLFKTIPEWISSSATIVSKSNSVLSNSVTVSSSVITSTIFRDTTYDRLDLWKVAYVMIENFPLLGVGPMHFYHFNTFGTHPHNSVLQIASEWGLPATMMILWIVGYCAFYWYKRFNASEIQSESKLNINLTIVLFFTVIANGAYSLVEGVIVMPISQVLMFTVIGIMIGQYTSGAWFKTNIITKKNFHFRPIFAGITLVFLMWSVMPELARGLKANELYFQPGERAFSTGPGTINPRIWMQQRRVEVKRKESHPTSRH